MTRGFVIDTPDLDLDDQDLTNLQNALDTNATRSEGPNHLLDADDLTKLKAALAGSTSCVSPNLSLAAPSIVRAGNAGLTGGGGGGGGSPVWLPTNATTFADFVNGHYWDGVAETSAVSMFKSDDFDGDPFTPGDIVAGNGYYDASGVDGAEAGAQFQGQAALSVGSEFVFVVEVDLDSPTTANFTSIAYDDAFIASSAPNTQLYGSLTPSGSVNLLDPTSTNKAEDAIGLLAGINRAAFRFSLSSLAVSINGRATISADDVSPNPIEYLTFFVSTSGGNAVGGTRCKIRSVTTYPNSTLDADLPALTALS